MAIGRKPRRELRIVDRVMSLNDDGGQIETEDDDDAPHHLHRPGALEQHQEGVDEDGHGQDVDEIGDRRPEGR